MISIATAIVEQEEVKTVQAEKDTFTFVINSEMVERRRAVPGEGLAGIDGAAA